MTREQAKGMIARFHSAILKGSATKVLHGSDPEFVAAYDALFAALAASPSETAPGERIFTTAECPTCGTEVDGIRVLVERDGVLVNPTAAAPPRPPSEPAPRFVGVDFAARADALAADLDKAIEDRNRWFDRAAARHNSMKVHRTYAAKMEEERNAALSALAASERREAEARAVLRQVEWGVLVVVLSDGSQAECCPCCNNYKAHGHSESCALARALGAEGGGDRG